MRNNWPQMMKSSIFCVHAWFQIFLQSKKGNSCRIEQWSIKTGACQGLGDRVERLSTLYSITWVVPTARIVKKKTTLQFISNIERGIFRVANFKSTAASRGFFCWFETKQVDF